jgi:hypothetical protein
MGSVRRLPWARSETPNSVSQRARSSPPAPVFHAPEATPSRVAHEYRLTYFLVARSNVPNHPATKPQRELFKRRRTLGRVEPPLMRLRHPITPSEFELGNRRFARTVACHRTRGVAGHSSRVSHRVLTWVTNPNGLRRLRVHGDERAAKEHNNEHSDWNDMPSRPATRAPIGPVAGLLDSTHARSAWVYRLDATRGQRSSRRRTSLARPR